MRTIESDIAVRFNPALQAGREAHAILFTTKAKTTTKTV